MNVELIENITKLRLMVGYLGEKEQFGWWQSSFFSQGSSTFLAPLFSRTQVLAQCNGVTQAAALSHDERIGVGKVYHLFRLPEDIEQAIHHALRESSVPDAIISKQAAMDELLKISTKTESSHEGPVLVGGKNLLFEKVTWQRVSGLYLEGFQRATKVFPYFSDNL